MEDFKLILRCAVAFTVLGLLGWLLRPYFTVITLGCCALSGLAAVLMVAIVAISNRE
jgi:hypothetical protein